MRKSITVFALAVNFLTVSAAHIGFLMPSGGQQGTTVDVIIGGQALWGVKSAIISGSGVEVVSVKTVRNLPLPDGKQRRYITKVLSNFHKNITAEVPKPEDTKSWRKHEYYDRLTDLTASERDILYNFLFVPRNSLQASPAISGRVIVQLKIAPDAAPGEREFRLLERNGKVSNPLRFFIGAAPEVREEYFPYPPAQKKPVAFTIPAALNGQIMPGESDKFTFQMKKDETVSFRLLGRYLNPFIGDGVPGHFQAVLEVTDKDNNTVAFADDYFFDPDPLLSFKAPADGEYTLIVRDAIYRGRADFVYRISAFKGLPPLPDAPPPPIPGVPVISKENALKKQTVKYPVMIKGALSDAAGDNFAVALNKGEEVVMEVFSRRLGLPPDGVIKVFDKKGKLLKFSDDVDRLKAGLILHNSADPKLIFTAPETAVYRINVSDNAGNSGDAYRYYLRIDRKRKLFSAYTVKSSQMVTAGSSSTLKIVVQREDDYNGEIKLRVKSPSVIRIVGIDSIPPGADSAMITLEGTLERTKPLLDLKLEAYTDDLTVPVIPGDEAMQAFAYTHIRDAACFPVRVNTRTSEARWQDPRKSYSIAPGKKIKLRIKSTPIYLKGEPVITLRAEDLPPWLKVVGNPAQKVKFVKLKNKRMQAFLPPLEIVLEATADAPGKAVNQIFTLNWEIVSNPDKNGKTRTIKNQIILPALRITGEK